ncbi:iron-containing alcohol dehydrogenase [Nocardia yamanashiensis]|uniref:2-deoxy-scyllo-inosose synthase n=1 Tax=Nocardia yamanashiensis TaxID=209247 RepID=UPI001E52F9EA|nr:2-deoxy-scyllo-inosose synthase [Nocardia yamanashiensis]UGT41932.1 iron-containing alcohol dehydrogenase [Nocardia yamanashiensis]
MNSTWPERSGLHSRTIRIGDRSFPYFFGADCVGEIADGLAGLGADLLVVVTDDQVRALYSGVLARWGERTRTVVLSHPAGESMKTLSCLAEHLEAALAAGATRRSVVVSFGGGVPGNLAGVMAGLLFRGVRLVHVPTTTIAAMDSVLSLKQAINSPVGKNGLGTYYAPAAVYTDVRFFTSLPIRELRSGLCEMAKNCLAIRPESIAGLRAVISGGDLGAPRALAWLLDASIDAKSAVTRDDTFERRAGLVLEYGHTTGHAIELCDHRARGAEGLPHGVAIALGMLVAAHISHARGWLSEDAVRTHYEIVTGLGVDPRLPAAVHADDVLRVIADDNKKGYLEPRADSVPFVLLRALGRPAMTGELPLVPVSHGEIRAALDLLARRPAALPAAG